MFQSYLYYTSMKRVLVIGPNSFIGSSIVGHLKSFYSDKFEICVTRRPNAHLPVFMNDLNIIDVEDNGRTLNATGKWNYFDYVIVCSTLYSKKVEDIQKINDVNIDFLSNILFSSNLKYNCLIYLNSFMGMEGYDWSYKSVYALSKTYTSKVSKLFCQKMNIRFINLYLFDVMGPHDTRNKFPNVLREAIKRKETVDASGGDQLIFPIHIKDLINIIVEIFENDSIVGDFQIRSPKGITLREFSELYFKTKGCSTTINWGFHPYFGDEMFVVPQEPDIYVPKSGFKSIHEIIEELVKLEGLTSE